MLLNLECLGKKVMKGMYVTDQFNNQFVNKEDCLQIYQ